MKVPDAPDLMEQLVAKPAVRVLDVLIYILGIQRTPGLIDRIRGRR